MKKLSIFWKKAVDKFWPEISSVFDYILFQLGVRSSKSIAGFSNTVVYVGEELHGRVTRVVRWTKQRSDYQTILFTYQTRNKKAFHFDQFDHFAVFRNKWHLKRKLLNLPSPVAVHTFGPKCRYPAAAIEHYQGKDVKTLYDLQDVTASNFGLNPPMKFMQDDLIYEKYCFEHADRIISFSLEPLNVREVYHVKYKEVLFFPNYLDDISFERKPKLDGLHLVYLGGVAGSDKPKNLLGCTMFFWLIEALSKQNIHFHIYPTPSRNNYLGEYEKIARENPYFHMHKPVPQNELATEISQYHFGVLPFFNEDDGRLPIKRKRSTSQKLFNYIEADLPILVSEDLKFQSWISGRIGMAVSMTKTDFSNVRAKTDVLDYNCMVKQLMEKRKNYYLKDKIDDLLNFYS